MEMVESMLRTSFCAVPPFMRVEPATISGPTATQISSSAASASGESGLHASATVSAPRARASVIAATVNGGVWRSLDGGATWLPLTDQLPSLAIGAVALAPKDKDGNNVTSTTPLSKLIAVTLLPTHYLPWAELLRTMRKASTCGPLDRLSY